MRSCVELDNQEMFNQYIHLVNVKSVVATFHITQ